ncbi:LuxR family two component transcriptional regulator [Acidovorax sp. 94]|jgi:DNA-binding NarL/FixJ family response regulator|nr:LuxR family two component transcriptional regulator [Acidovorax sp. 94]
MGREERRKLVSCFSFHAWGGMVPTQNARGHMPFGPCRGPGLHAILCNVKNFTKNGDPALDPLNGFALLLVDDHPLFRDGLAAALRHQAPGLRVQAVGSPAEAIDLLAGHGEGESEGFDLVLLDYRLPGMDGLRCAALLMAQHPGMGVGLMSGVDDPTLARRTQDAGLVAYLPKTLEVPALLAQLRQLAEGEPSFAVAAQPPDAEQPTGPYGLTARQIDVLHMLASGGSNKEIARAMGISPGTVKNHLNAIFTKMGAANRVQAVMMAQAVIREAT